MEGCSCELVCMSGLGNTAGSNEGICCPIAGNVGLYQGVRPTAVLQPVSQQLKLREREMFYLTTHSTHFIYGYMASDIWLRTILIVRKETRCRHIGYSYRLTARVLLCAPSHRQDNTYHGLCYTSRGALAGTRNSSMAAGGTLVYTDGRGVTDLAVEMFCPVCIHWHQYLIF